MVSKLPVNTVTGTPNHAGLHNGTNTAFNAALFASGQTDTDTGWVTPTLGAGVTDLDGVTGGMRVRIKNGILFINMSVKRAPGSSASAPIITLPWTITHGILGNNAKVRALVMTDSGANNVDVSSTQVFSNVVSGNIYGMIAIPIA